MRHTQALVPSLHLASLLMALPAYCPILCPLLLAWVVSAAQI